MIGCTVGAMAVTQLVDHLLRRGESPGAIRDRIGVFPDRLHDSTTRLPVHGVFALWEHAVTTLDDPDLPTRLSRSATLEAAHLLGFLCLTAPTARAALDAVVAYGSLHTDSGSWLLSETGRTVTLRWARPARLTLGHRLCNEAALTRLMNGVRCGTQTDFAARRVWLRHHPGRGLRALSDYFGCRVETGARDEGISFDRDLLDATPPQRNPAMWTLLRSLADEEVAKLRPRPLIDRVTIDLARELARGDEAEIAAVDVARRLGVSERGLRRRLAASGSGFRRLLEEARRLRAEELLRGSHGVTQVAFETGYSDASAFNHAFRRWFGCSPRAWRARCNALERCLTPSSGRPSFRPG